MARKPNWVRIAEKNKNKQARLETKVEVKPTKPVKKLQKQKSVGNLSAGNATTVKKLADDINSITSSAIRAEMNKRAHVLVINAAQFASLAKDHKLELKRVAEKSENETVKKYLENISSGINTYQVGTKLYKRFKIILEKHLPRLPKGISWSKEERNNVTLYYFKNNGTTNKDIDIFRYIRDSVFKEIREDLVYNSKAGTYRRALSVIIAGIDIDHNDIVKSTGDTAKRTRLLDTSRLPEDKAGTGIQLGHFRGPNTVAASRVLSKVKSYSANIIAFTGMSFAGQKHVEMIHKQDAEIRFNDVVWQMAKNSKELGGEARITIIGLEQSARNSITGNIAGTMLNRFKTWVTVNAAALLTLPGSKPIINMILDDVTDALLYGEGKKRAINKVYKAKTKTVKGKAGASNSKLKTKTDSSKLRNAVAQSSGNEMDLRSTINLINSKLHDKIRENMGKGSARQILNYRTGRFAKSAKIRDLYDTGHKSIIGADVEYMRYPYGVFEPGGRLYKPGRDPHRIIGRSIRQILQEEKIITLRQVKVRLNG